MERIPRCHAQSYRDEKMKEPRSYGWKNVIYQSREELPSDVKTFDNPEWVEKQNNRIRNMIISERELLIQRNKILIQYVNSIKKENVTVLDYGGSLGTSYLPLKDNNSGKKLNYHVVEVPGMVKTANKVFVSDSCINFSSTIPEDLDQVDIVYIRTSLQYSEDWRKTLQSLFNIGATYFILAHVSAGDIPTYLTLQLWGSYEIPYWFINKNELKQVANQNQYNCVDDHVCYDMTTDAGWETYKHFPHRYRLQELSNIIFKKDF